ncbi:hypothetical protein SELMODRAFT_101726 [Selaginella moellendorffii]|uniref:Pentacotripeptide-repeat region of PRORP domain-containing protein n=1 Tax=Selaginella moellendorffii TaxID=88036 RepID=D8RUD3_SELML|nr:hypothetical protein SELMODRAFT_101726 [Selaginella moellendorffii]
MPEWDLISSTAILSAIAQSGDLEISKAIYDSSHEHDLALQNAMLVAYSRNGQIESSKHIFDSMEFHDLVSWNSMISAFAQTGHLEEASSFFAAMPARDLFSWSAMLNGHSRDAFEVFQCMAMEGVDPDKSALMGVIDASSGLACTTKAKIIHMIVEELVHPPDAGIDTKLVSMFAKCGCPEAAREIFDRMEDRGRVAWNSMLAAYAQNERGAETLQLFKEMELEGIEVDEVSFVCVLSVCSHAGMLATACCEFSSMVGDFEIAPVVDHFNCVIDLLGRLGRIADAQEIVLEMPFEPGTVSWRSVLSACGLQGNVQKASLAATELHNLENQDGGPFVLLSNVHARA